MKTPTVPQIDEMKRCIDSMSYHTLLERWRFAPIGDPMFQGEVGDYYSKVMKQKRAEAGPAGHTAASKSIGWE